MKNIEKKIAHLVESQFPAFYHEEGPVFIAFVRAYFEFLEQFGYPGSDSHNSIYQARSLMEYRDIDTTLDEFIVHFKEKYLKNIQFDTATNKQLLVKNSLDLYRSKGTERSIDLFFKLIYGSGAAIQYPAEKIFKLSAGIWDKPIYLEVTPNRYNVNYVGKQIIGARSGAKAFVERYIKRQTNRGPVDIFYISNLEGEFFNNESLGINVDNTPVFDKDMTSRVLGSVRRAIIQSKGQDFRIGDLVDLISANRGVGAVARVANTSAATGIINFDFIDGGYGYTLSSNSIISEKVVTFKNVTTYPTFLQDYGDLLEEAVQPNINVAFSNATSALTVGDILTRYNSGSPVARGVVIAVNQENDTGTATIDHRFGAFVNSVTYYTSSNAISLYANTVEDRSISSKLMGISDSVILDVSNRTDEFSIGSLLRQEIAEGKYATGIVTSVSNNTIEIDSISGSFKNSQTLSDFYYTNGTGTISANVNSPIVSGSGTNFDPSFIDALLYDTSANTLIGTVRTVSNSTVATLYNNSLVNVTGVSFAHTKAFQLEDSEDPSNSADIETIRLDMGFYNIRKYIRGIEFNNANNDSITNTTYIQSYNLDGDVIAKASVVTAEYSANSGSLTFLPIRGSFKTGDLVYSDSNTAVATVTFPTVVEDGGDYIESINSRLIFLSSNTYANLLSISFGTGAGFSVGSLSDTEIISIGTDLLGSNNVGYTDFERKTLNVTSNSGFSIGDLVSQTVNEIAFDSSDIDIASGFIPVDSANTRFSIDDVVRYKVATGNTAINDLNVDESYKITFANSTGIIISHLWDDRNINTSWLPDFANNVVSETGHYFYQESAATIYNLGSGALKIKDVYGTFSESGGIANTTTFANSNVYLESDNSTNTDILSISSVPGELVANQAYMSLELKQAAYGFPKDIQGDIKTNIYSCLGFETLEIGVISSLAEINPGIDYNIDPFILVYEPFIAAFDRRDFVINISGATRSYVTGEQVFQTLPNLIKFDLEVDNGTLGNSFNQVISSFNSEYDIDDSNEFILIPSASFQFNSNTDVNANLEFITLSNNSLVVGNYLRYYTDTGNTAITGLANNSFYYVVESNTSGVSLSATQGGANISLTEGVTETGHHFLQYENSFQDGQLVRYTVPNGNTEISGLTDDDVYYVVGSNSVGISLATTDGGSPIDLTANSTGGETHILTSLPGFLPGDGVSQIINKSFNSNTAIVANSITLSNQPYSDGNEVRYYTSSGNTVLTNLANNTNYYITEANSTAVKLSSTVGGSPIALGSGVTESGHYLESIATGTIDFIENDTIRIKNVTNSFANGFVIYSVSNPNLSANVLNVELLSISTTARGIVKEGSNTSVLNVKRLSFENTFIEGGALIGQASGANSTIVSIYEDDVLPIGMNAIIEGESSIANGQISELQIIDSGFAYTNNELVTLTSDDGRAGSALVQIDGSGISRGYYKSTTGFLSNDNYIHDGDYYQEYSYEIFSRIPVDRYADMFRKVMHTAGTKFFGSVLVEETEETLIGLSASGMDQVVEFDPYVDISSNKISVEEETNYRSFNAITVDSVNDFIPIGLNPYDEGDVVTYYTMLGNTVISGLANNSSYYVVGSNTSGIKLSNTFDGTPINISAGSNEFGHGFFEYWNPFNENDIVRYDTEETPVAGLTAGSLYLAANVTPTDFSLANTETGAIINITSTISDPSHYLTKIEDFE